jgi:hypothetical protein
MSESERTAFENMPMRSSDRREFYFYTPDGDEAVMADEYTELKAADALAELRERSDYTAAAWPELKWRGDGFRRALTCGTLLSIIGAHEASGEGGDAVTVARTLSELRRLASKYDPEQRPELRDKPIHGGDEIYTSTPEVVSIIAALCDISGVVQMETATVEMTPKPPSEPITPTNDTHPTDTSGNDDTPKRRGRKPSPYTLPDDPKDPEEVERELANRKYVLPDPPPLLGTAFTGVVTTTLLRLTVRGVERLNVLLGMALDDPRYDGIDLSDPILEYNPALDLRATAHEDAETRAKREQRVSDEEEAREAVLPPRRNSGQPPGYRSWMWIVKRSPLSYAYGSTGTDADTVLTQLNTAPGAECAECASRVSKAMFIRPFLDLVLSGGPEMIWAGKPIKPESIHHDVEVFSAASHSGFTPDMVRMSSLAWEMFEQDHTPASVYRAYTEKFSVMRDDNEQDGVYLYRGPGLLEAMLRQAYDIDGADGEWVDPDELDAIPAAPHTAAHLRKDGTERLITDLDTAEAIVGKSTAEALMDALAGGGVHVPGGNRALPHEKGRLVGSVKKPGKAPVLGCTYIRPDDRRCTNPSTGGSGRCDLHGGRLLDTNETASLIRAQQVRIFAGVPKALDTIFELMEHSAQDAVRLRAAETWLSRAGVSERKEITLDIGINTTDDAAVNDPGSVIRKRLEQLGLAGERDAAAAANPVGVPIEGEAVTVSLVERGQSAYAEQSCDDDERDNGD